MTAGGRAGDGDLIALSYNGTMTNTGGMYDDGAIGGNGTNPGHGGNGGLIVISGDNNPIGNFLNPLSQISLLRTFEFVEKSSLSKPHKLASSMDTDFVTVLQPAHQIPLLSRLKAFLIRSLAAYAYPGSVLLPIASIGHSLP